MGSRNGGIRNVSMKKFGTPTAAAPGCANENVGLLGVGDPSGFAVFAFGLAAFFLGCVLVLQRGAATFGRRAVWPSALSCADRMATGLRGVRVAVATQRLCGFVDVARRLGLCLRFGGGAGTVTVGVGATVVVPRCEGASVVVVG